MRNLPSKIRVIGFDYRVDVTKNSLVLNGNDCHAVVYHDDKRIIVTDSCVNTSNALETMIHEVLHAIAEAMDHNDGEDSLTEHEVSYISRGIASVLIDNPEFSSWMKSEAKRVGKQHSKKDTD